MLKPLKVLLTTGIFPPDSGGPAVYVPALAAALVGRGHQVRVLCLANAVFTTASYPFEVYRINRSVFLPWRILYTTYMVYKHAKWSQIVLANTLPQESKWGALLANRPIVHKIVGDYAWEMARNKGWFADTIDAYQTARKGRRLKALDFWRNLAFRNSNALFVPSLYLAQIVEGWGVTQKKVQIVYNAVPIAPQPPRPQPSNNEPVTLLTVCRLVPWKGVEELIRLLLKFERFSLVVAGDGPLLLVLKAIVAELGLDTRVRFLGNVSKEVVLKNMMEADIFVLNSSYEGLPHVVLEAMACGLPVICRDAGGCNEVVRHYETGFLVNDARPDCTLYEALNLLEQKPEMYFRFAAQAHAIIGSRFSYEAMVEQTERLLQKVCDN